MTSDTQPTRPSLLLRVRDPQDTRAWDQFVEIYTPLVYRFCRRHDLQDADAADVCQEVMRTVARSAERFEYDSSRGKFRSWLLAVTRSKVNDSLSRRQRQADPASATHLQQLVDEQVTSTEQSDWDEEYHRQVFHWAAGQIRSEFQEKSWQAFWQTTVEQRTGKEVAGNLEMSIGAVYVARSRILARLREEIRKVEEDVSAQSDYSAPEVGERRSPD